MTTGRRRVRRSLAAVLWLVVGLTMLDVAAAATLDVRAGKLTAISMPVERCLSDVAIIPVIRDSNWVAVVATGIDPACDGQTVEVAIANTSGTLLTSGSSAVVVTQPTLTIPLPPTPAVAYSSGHVVTLAVKGFPLTRITPQIQYSMTINYDNGPQYGVTVNVTTSSASPLTWSFVLRMGGYPLDGNALCGTSNANVSLSGAGVLTATGVPFNAQVSASTSRSFQFCMQRSAIAHGGVDFTVVPDSIQSNSYCANVTVSNPTAVPRTWTFVANISQYHPWGGYGGNTTSVSNANASYDASTSTLTATGTGGWSGTEVVPASGTRTWRYCMQNLTVPIPEDVVIASPVTVGPSSHWGDSYQATVTVSAPEQTEVTPWQVQIDLSQTPYGVPASIGSLWTSGTAPTWSYAAPILTVSSNQLSHYVSATTTFTFNFAAANVSPAPPRVPHPVGESWSGQCVTATVVGTSADWQAWETVLDLSGRTGQPGAISNGVGSWNAGTRQLTVWGTSGTWPIRQGTNRTFNFCMTP